MGNSNTRNPLKLIYAAVLFCVGIVFSGCGTVSEMETSGANANFSEARYTKVAILDFTNGASTNKTKADDIAEFNESVEIAGRLFADKIAAELRKEKLFPEIVREEVEGPALVIYGTITRMEEGNAAARLFIGLGAGSSYFDAEVLFTDNVDGENLGVMKIDKNSWALGGGIAAGQTVEGYMDKGAEKIAEEIIKARAEQNTPRTGN
jgi:uncharacterized protein YceK